MANRNNYWTVRESKKWAVKREGSDRLSAVHSTQADAWSDARRRARAAGGEAFLQDRDGRIRARNTYGVDPYPPKG